MADDLVPQQEQLNIYIMSQTLTNMAFDRTMVGRVDNLQAHLISNNAFNLRVYFSRTLSINGVPS